MKKIIALLLAMITVFSLVACNSTGSQENTQMDNNQSQNNTEDTNKTDNGSKWDIIYNLDDFTDEWWNSPHETFSANTNKELFDSRTGSSVGYLDGVLSVGTMDLEIPVYTSASTHILKLENNKFIIPREINRLDNREYGNENSLDCIVLTKDFESCLIRIDFSSISFLQESNDVDIKEGEWVVTENHYEDGGDAYYYGTYGLDERFCLQIHIMDDQIIDSENRKHLVEELCEFIKIEDFEDDGKSYVKLNHQINIADNIQFVTGGHNIIKWHSGYDGHNAFSGAQSGSRIDLMNNNNKEVVLKEFAPGTIVADKYYVSRGYMLEKYDLNGHEVFIIRNDPEQMPWANAEINGFYFCANDAVYELMINEHVDEPDDVNAWITSLIDGILVFN